jgi:hypothetical protein
LLILAVITLALALNAIDGHDGRLFLVALGATAGARAVVAMTWRDPAVLAGFNAGTLIAAAVTLGCVVAWVVTRRSPRTRVRADEPREVTWADPEARPRF